jgi:Nif-specific regulatory protein
MLSPTVPSWTVPEPQPLNSEETRKLAVLRDIGQLLAEQPDLRVALKGVLQTLTTRAAVGIAGGTVLVFGDNGARIDIHVTEGPFAARPRGAISMTTGVAGQVMQSGRPLVVPYVARNNPGAATKAQSARELTQVAAPITLEGRVVGAISLDYQYDPDRDLHRSMSCASLVASMIAQAVAASRRAEQDRQRLLDETSDLRTRIQEQPDFPRLVGTSAPLGQVQTQVAQVAATNTTVMLRGESGTGKGLIAQAIHHNSPRARKPFVTVSCAALPPDLIESELFGYERGAFTGAQAQKRGRLELANGGTLFLDEIGELSPGVQVKLLRVLQQREFERLGGTQTLPLDVRVLAATNKNLEKAIAAGEFREDLYYRLNVFSIFVPPLRERKADVLLLADHFLERFAREHGKNVRRISTPAIDMLASYHWPGNVRELSNAIERAVVLCDGGVVHSHHLPPTLQTAESSGTMANLSLQEMVEAVEKDALQDALKTARGNRATAARLLRTTRRIFNYKVRNYGIDWRRFREVGEAPATFPRASRSS